MSITIRHLFISPDHNYYGRHGEASGDHPSVEAKRLQLEAGLGIVGDRFHGYKKNYKGQITFFDYAVYADIRNQLGVQDLLPSAFRRNALIDGIDLNTLIGKTFQLGGLRFEGVEECRPCYWMDEACGPGAEDLMKGRGGLRARILTSGWLESGPAEIEIE